MSINLAAGMDRGVDHEKYEGDNVQEVYKAPTIVWAPSRGLLGKVSRIRQTTLRASYVDVSREFGQLVCHGR